VSSAVGLDSHPQGAPWGVAVDSSGIYWTNTSESDGGAGGSVVMLAPGSGTPFTLASAQPVAFSIFLTPTAIYWTDYSADAGTVMKLAK